MRRHEDKDAELDRRIAALRKKNQALLRRYQVSVLERRRGLPSLSALKACSCSRFFLRHLDLISRP